MNLEDIARKAGVSRSTVSRVINHEPGVKDSTRRRVMTVIEQENFQPNPAARALVTRRTGIIGVAIPQTTNVFYGDNSYFPMLLQGFAEAINRRDYSMLLWLAETHEVRDSFAARVARHRQPDGVIITSVVDDDPLFRHLVRNNRLFVMVEMPPVGYDDLVSYVTVDNVAAAEEAVTHLINAGYRRIATITGQLNIRDGQDRLIGYRNALHKAGLPVDENLIISGSFAREYGYVGMKRLLKYQPDAVFAGGDTIAIGVLEAAHEAGLRVPDDLGVVGFDDLDVAVKADLTTVRHSVQQVGSNAAELLIDLIEGRLEHPHRVIMPTELVIRGTTRPAQAR